jgi:hypothetical protein
LTIDEVDEAIFSIVADKKGADLTPGHKKLAYV